LYTFSSRGLIDLIESILGVIVNGGSAYFLNNSIAFDESLEYSIVLALSFPEDVRRGLQLKNKQTITIRVPKLNINECVFIDSLKIIPLFEKL
jgi:hypothetical protein